MNSSVHSLQSEVSLTVSPSIVPHNPRVAHLASITFQYWPHHGSLIIDHARSEASPRNCSTLVLSVQIRVHSKCIYVYAVDRLLSRNIRQGEVTQSSLRPPPRPTLGGGGTRFQRGLGRVMMELVRLEMTDV